MVNIEKNIFNNNHNSANKPNTTFGDRSPEKATFSSLNEILAKKDQIKSKLAQMSKPKNKIVGGFELGRTLGKGKFGEVYLAK